MGRRAGSAGSLPPTRVETVDWTMASRERIAGLRAGSPSHGTGHPRTDRPVALLFIRLLIVQRLDDGTAISGLSPPGGTYPWPIREPGALGPAHRQLHPQRVDGPGGPGADDHRPARARSRGPASSPVRPGDPVPPRAGPRLPARAAAAAAGHAAGPDRRPRRSTATIIVQANDHEMARDFLEGPCGPSIENLQRMVHPGGMLVSINPERLLVQVDRNLGQSVEALAHAVREALVIHDGLLEGVHRRMNQGIAIVDRQDAWDGGHRAAHLQGLRRADHRRRRDRLCRLQYAPSPRLLGIRRCLLDLRLQRQGRRDRVSDVPIVDRSPITSDRIPGNGVDPMPSPRRRRLAALTLLFAGLSVAPAAPATQPAEAVAAGRGPIPTRP